MANFNTHLFVAASASITAAATTYSNNLIELLDIPWFIFLGTIGGLLPDIDSDHSRPLKLLFDALAILAALVTILTYKDQYEMQYLFIIASGAFFIVRFPVLSAFKSLTVHRGVFHSLLSATFFTLLTVCISHTVLHSSIYFAWMSGLFIGFGFTIHLILDECYSVDLSNAKFKRSFGTAFKLFSLRYLHASFAMFFACTLLYLHAPAFPFKNQKALTMINLALDASSSTLEKYFCKLAW